MHLCCIILLSLKVIKSTMEHLSSLTSILLLLSHKHPESKEDLLSLRMAISSWYKGVQQSILQKNKEIRKLQEKPYQPSTKLTLLLMQIAEYLDKVMEYYDDPNMNNFHTEYQRLMAQFQFSDVDLDKFKKNLIKPSIQVQTDQQPFFDGKTDFKKIILIMEEKQSKINELASFNEDLTKENMKLSSKLNQLQGQLLYKSQVLTQAKDKIHNLTNLYQRLKEQQRNTLISPIYRSSPEINIKQKNVFDDLEAISFNDTFQQEEKLTPIDEDYWRMMLSQSICIQQLYSKIQLQK